MKQLEGERKLGESFDVDSAQRQRDFGPGFHDRLSRNWPEPREQLHYGGWKATKWMVQELAIGAEDSVLDVCCGEGGTATWLARAFGINVTGIDIVCPAIETARDRAQREGVESKCEFVCGDVFSMPCENDSFDIIIGQDADGFAYAKRDEVFRECFRVLRSGGRMGLQHWIPGLGAPSEIIERFDKANIDAGYPSMINISAAAYVQAMQEAGFQEIRTIDKSDMYRRHTLAIQEQARKTNEEIDPWTATWLELSGLHPFGVAIVAGKA